MAVDAIRFSGVNIGAYFRGISIERTALPNIEPQTVEIPRKMGTTVLGVQVAPLEITITGAINAQKAQDVATIRRALARALMPDEDGSLKALVLPDQPDVTYFAIVSGSTGLDRGYNHPHVTITFLVPDGCAYGPEVTKSLGSSFTVDGDLPALPIVNVSNLSAGSTATISRTDTTGTRQVKLTARTSGGVSCDMATDKVTNGALSLDSDPFSLAPGSVSTSISGASGTIKYRERWL